MLKEFSAANDSKIAKYLEETFKPQDRVLREICEDTVSAGLPQIQLGAMDGLHLEVLTRAVGAKKCVEIGTLAGYSGVCLLRGMGSKGQLYTFEKDPKHAALAEKSFKKAGFAANVEIFVGDALPELEKINSKGPFDLVFIDADKENYPNYLAWAAEYLRVGGMIIGDNTFAFGMIGDEVIDHPNSLAIVTALRAFNRELASGGRFRSTILPTGEGLSVGIKIK